ncbi:hexokinase-2, chloroplastic-like [Papaver somniferum]|uniref:hexokinase-2, chloroplastic-like n=1 Tax=Papaver somniferum TaxID=3469 RepID=UPI000E6F9C00|nr:hexokinase-2, chloroplastic-like [Papaver somniferum]
MWVASKSTDFTRCSPESKHRHWAAKVLKRGQRQRMADSSSSISEKSILENLQTDCATPLNVLGNIADSMIAQMKDGLDHGGSDLQMLLSYVNSLRTGQEKGLFYALDLGGTNFRVLRVQLDGEGNVVVEKNSWEIPEDRRTGTQEGLFGFIASGLAEFIVEECEKYKIPLDTKREIGFTFSFPTNQTSINEGTLIEWTKGFNISDTIGKDVVACLKEAIVVKQLDMFSVTVLINDSVGALAGARYKDSDVKVAVILGTGTNACYLDENNVFIKFQIINTEWGAFFDQGVLPLTEFDQHLTMLDVFNCLKQIYEKMISGKYLGVLVSKILLKMAESENLFGKYYTAPKDILLLLREVACELCGTGDSSGGLETVGLILNERLKVETSLDVRRTVVNVIDTIVKRAARLAGAGIVAILKKMEQDTPGLIYEKRTVVAIDGSLYEQYQQYQLYLKEVVTELLGPFVFIKQFPDASGVGAALLSGIE